MENRVLTIAILGINYAPEPTGIAPYTAGMATALAARGHDVQVFTGYPHYPDWRPNAGGFEFRSEEMLDGVLVHRFKHPVPQRFSWFRRALMELAFGMQLATTRWGGPDVVICVTPPLLAATIAVARARLTPRRSAIGILVQDVYSRGIAETRAASGFGARLLANVEAATLKMADGVSTIHRGFTGDVTSNLGVDAKRVREIRNWTHVGTADSTESRAFREAHGWNRDEVVVLHAGNMGYKQGLENVVSAAALAEESGAPVKFVLLGDGNQRSMLQRRSAGLTNLEFLDTVEEERFPAALGAADILLVNERTGVAQMSVPSKLTSYFKAAKPVLAAVDEAGYAASELAAAGAGVRVPPDRPDLLLEEALRLGADRDTAARLGAAGHRYSEETLSRDASIDSYEQWMYWLVDSQTRRSGTGKVLDR